jgi:hypothetical protein
MHLEPSRAVRCKVTVVTRETLGDAGSQSARAGDELLQAAIGPKACFDHAPPEDVPEAGVAHSAPPSRGSEARAIRATLLLIGALLSFYCISKDWRYHPPLASAIAAPIHRQPEGSHLPHQPGAGMVMACSHCGMNQTR